MTGASPSGEAPFDLDAYLARIGYPRDTVAVGREDLAAMHQAHVTAIPFENLDSRRGVVVSVDQADIERKLVAQRRGGYCFEHNLLFAAALRTCGFQVEPMLARVGPRDDPARSLTHLLLRVACEDALWHADVGFGAGTLLEPIPFGPGEAVRQGGWSRQVVASGDELVLRSAGTDGVWSDLYRFRPVPVAFIDIEMSNWFTCTYPGSQFVTNLNVTIHRADGSRLVLFARGDSTRLIDQTPAGDTVQEIERAKVPGLLAERFGLPGWTLDDDGVPVPGR